MIPTTLGAVRSWVDRMLSWDQRYSEPGFAYGAEPNEFLVDVAEGIPEGPVLCLAEGEGRNAVHLAEQGYEVTAVDASPVGLAKARNFAQGVGVPLETVPADLAEYDLGRARWSGIVSIFAHLPPPLRLSVHQAVVGALRPGGVFVLEAFTPAQLQHGTGGPAAVELLYSLDTLREELDGLDLTTAQELEREINEGKYHHGLAAVVQIVGVKPK